jgi:hypothetical protein
MNEGIKRGYEDLANAIIIQAADDYRSLLGGAKSSIGVNQTELEKFFKSEWYRVLSDVDGESLMNRIRKECGQCV